MVFMSRRSLEAGILVAFAILAVGFASFFERNETSEVASEDISVSSESSVTDTQHPAASFVWHHALLPQFAIVRALEEGHATLSIAPRAEA